MQLFCAAALSDLLMPRGPSGAKGLRAAETRQRAVRSCMSGSGGVHLHAPALRPGARSLCPALVPLCPRTCSAALCSATVARASARDRFCCAASRRRPSSSYTATAAVHGEPSDAVLAHKRVYPCCVCCGIYA